MKVILIFLLIVTAALNVFSQRIAAKKIGATKFTSVYTDLSQNCVADATSKQRRAMENRGQDVPLVCTGFGGYRLHITFSAIEQFLSVANGLRYEDQISIRPKDSKFLEQFGRRVEWRLANRKPFAVIIRFEHFSGDCIDGESPFDQKRKVGESLIVQGLKNFESIYFEVDAKTPDANLRARDLADSEYMKNDLSKAGLKAGDLKDSG